MRHGTAALRNLFSSTCGASSLLLELVESVQDLIQCEAIPGGPRQELGQDLVQHAAPFQRIDLGPVIGHEGPGTLLGVHDAPELHLPVSPDDGVGVDFQVHGELPNGGQPVPGSQVAPSDGEVHRLDDLPVQGNAALRIDGDCQCVVWVRVLEY